MSDIENSSLDNHEKKQSGTPMLQICIGLVYGTFVGLKSRVTSLFNRRSVSDESAVDDSSDQPAQLAQSDKELGDRLGDTAEMPESNQPDQQEEQGLPTEQIIVPIDDIDSAEPSETPSNMATITDVLQGRFNDLSNNLQELSGHFENLQSSINELSSQITDKIKTDRMREDTIRGMDLELQEYRQDRLFDAIRPICMAMIALHDHVAIYMSRSESDVDAGDVIGSILEEISGNLRIAGVEEYWTEGKEFHASAMSHAIETEHTESDDLNGKVFKTITKGYGLRGKVLRPERVSVYKK